MKIKALSLFALTLLLQEATPVNIYNEALNRVHNKVKHRHGHHGHHSSRLYIVDNLLTSLSDDILKTFSTPKKPIKLKMKQKIKIKMKNPPKAVK